MLCSAGFIVGYSVGEILKTCWKELLLPIEEEVDFTIFNSEYLYAYKSGLDMHNECRLRHQDTPELELRSGFSFSAGIRLPIRT